MVKTTYFYCIDIKEKCLNEINLTEREHEMRTEESTRKFGDLAIGALARLEAGRKAYKEKIESGEIKPPRDANGNIIPTPSARKPNVFDGLRLTEDNPAEIG